MHELSLSLNIVSQLSSQQQQHAFSRVLSLRLAIGELSCVDTESLLFSFSLAAQGSCAEDCEVQIDKIEGVASCHNCGCLFKLSRLGEACRDCGGYDSSIVTGNELNIVEIEVS